MHATEHSTLETSSQAERGAETDAASQPVKLETTGVTEQTRQAGLWPSAILHALSTAAKLRSIGLETHARKLEYCHTEWTIAKCNNCHATQTFPNRCENFFCAKCQPYLSLKRRRAVEWWSTRAQQPKHVVLTVQNTEQLTHQHVLEFKSWFRKLRRSAFARNWQGGFYSIEVTKEGQGWHLHLHAIVDAMWIDSFGLSAAWANATNGFGRIVKVKDARARDYLKEVTKYAVKGSQLAAWAPGDIKAFIESFTGLRTFGVFGSLYGKRTEWKAWLATLKQHGHACECGCTKFTFYTELEWIARDLVPDGQASIPPPEFIHQLKFPQLTSEAHS